MSDQSLHYCERRAREEDRAAERASCMEATLAHRQLARRFAAKARKLRQQNGIAGRAKRPTVSIRAAR
ncbi:hypothetical protein [Sphingobium sp.]|uniref:hypothetical protein n=1 Tax=Sphingobium sp. TaxID=1912891 RepID=UPI0028BDC2BC|nr:hypothetical protein [Sphingobium sp.]